MTPWGPDFEDPWVGSEPPTWEQWAEEGLLHLKGLLIFYGVLCLFFDAMNQSC